MKKIFILIAIVSIFAFSLSAFAMTQIADSDLSSVTGQSGVSINLDTRIDLNIGTVAWGDIDGFVLSNVDGNTSGETNSAGWVGLKNLVVDNLRIRADQSLLATAYNYIQPALTWAGDMGPTSNGGKVLAFTQFATPTAIGGLVGAYNTAYPSATTGSYATILGRFGTGTNDPATVAGWAAFYGLYANYSVASGGTYHTGAIGSGYLTYLTYKGASDSFKPLTIDVATDTGTGHGVVGTTFVRIGLGSLEIGMDSMNADVKVGSDNTLGVGTLGSIYVGSMMVRINGNSYVDIYARDSGNAGSNSGQGVGIGLNVKLNQFTIGTLAWGDKDGLGTSPTTGTSLGLPFTYDVPGWFAATTVGWVGLNNLNVANLTVIGNIGIDVATNSSTWTFVNIGMTGLSVNTGTITATAALGSSTTLDQELGSIYISGLNVTVNGNLQIGARANGTQGVTINLDNLTVSINGTSTISWGDNDGFTGALNPGYVGLKNLAITGLTLNGPVNIDVASINDSLIVVPSDVFLSMNRLMYGTYASHYMSKSWIHLGLGGDANLPALSGTTLINGAFGVSMTSLAADVAFGNSPDLVTGTASRTMGKLFLGDVNVGINGWVDIAAH